ncbi:MAG: DUF4328 domain-containing protein [Micromonospora sp.]
MRCQNCGTESAALAADCRTCGHPLDPPPLSPGVATYGVRGLGIAAAVGLGLTTLLYVLAALAPAVAATRAGHTPAGDLRRFAALANVLLSGPYLLVYLTTGALVMIWMFRARKNTDAFPGRPSQLAAHWAITGWWVPIASLVVPCVVMMRIVRDSLGRVRLRALVALWWVAWLVFSIGDLVSSLGALKAEARLAQEGRGQDFAYYREAALRNAVPALACLVAGVSLIVLILRISAAQQARIAPRTADWPAPPGWPASPADQQPVTVPSPLVAAESTPVSTPVAPGAGGTIRA